MKVIGKDIADLLAIQEWSIKKYESDSDDNTVTFYISKNPGTGYECSRCSTLVLYPYDHYQERRVRDLSIWGKRSYLSFSQARICCPRCKRIVAERLDLTEFHSRMTTRYEKYLASLCDFMPVADVNRLEGINKNTLYRIDKKWLEWRKSHCSSEDVVEYLGIDEIAIKKNHKYATVFYDLKRSRVIGLVEGRDTANVNRFFRKWGRESCHKVKAVCTDLWSAFHKSVKKYLKNAKLVFDKFHVFSYLSNAIEQVRRSEQSKLEEGGMKILKGSRWLILKNSLSEKENGRLQKILELNENIAKAYLLKEDFGRFYKAQTREEAEEILFEWIKECKESKLKPFIKLAQRLNRWKQGILEYFNYKITNGISEGINNKIKVIKRRSYGFYDMNYFFLKILKATGYLPYMLEIN